MEETIIANVDGRDVYRTLAALTPDRMKVVEEPEYLTEIPFPPDDIAWRFEIFGFNAQQRRKPYG